MRNFKQKLQSFFLKPYCLQVLRFISFFLAFVAVFLMLEPVQAQSLNVNPCQIFIQNQKSPTDFAVSHVEIISDSGQGDVAVMILGLPKKVFATFNGIDVSNLKTRSQGIKCSGRQIGEIAVYNLRSLNVDAGYFQVNAGRFGDGASINLR